METRTSPASVHYRSCGNLIGPFSCVGIATLYGTDGDALEIDNSLISFNPVLIIELLFQKRRYFLIKCMLVILLKLLKEVLQTIPQG